MKPYEYTDDLGKLTISKGAGYAFLHVDDGDTARTRVFPDWVPEVALALYEAAALPAPLILPRPEHTGDTEYVGSSDRYAYTSLVGLNVAIGWRGIEPAEFDPDEALMFAAHIAVNAEAAKRREPDPAEVDELAGLIADAYGLDHLSRYDLARKILLGGWKRETRA